MGKYRIVAGVAILAVFTAVRLAAATAIAYVDGGSPSTLTYKRSDGKRVYLFLEKRDGKVVPVFSRTYTDLNVTVPAGSTFEEALSSATERGAIVPRRPEDDATVEGENGATFHPFSTGVYLFSAPSAPLSRGFFYSDEFAKKTDVTGIFSVRYDGDSKTRSLYERTLSNVTPRNFAYYYSGEREFDEQLHNLEKARNDILSGIKEDERRSFYERKFDFMKKVMEAAKKIAEAGDESWRNVSSFIPFKSLSPTLEEVVSGRFDVPSSMRDAPFYKFKNGKMYKIDLKKLEKNVRRRIYLAYGDPDVDSYYVEATIDDYRKKSFFDRNVLSGKVFDGIPQAVERNGFPKIPGIESIKVVYSRSYVYNDVQKLFDGNDSSIDDFLAGIRPVALVGSFDVKNGKAEKIFYVSSFKGAVNRSVEPREASVEAHSASPTSNPSPTLDPSNPAVTEPASETNSEYENLVAVAFVPYYSSFPFPLPREAFAEANEDFSGNPSVPFSRNAGEILLYEADGGFKPKRLLKKVPLTYEDAWRVLADTFYFAGKNENCSSGESLYDCYGGHDGKDYVDLFEYLVEGKTGITLKDGGKGALTIYHAFVLDSDEVVSKRPDGTTSRVDSPSARKRIYEQYFTDCVSGGCSQSGSGSQFPTGVVKASAFVPFKVKSEEVNAAYPVPVFEKRGDTAVLVKEIWEPDKVECDALFYWDSSPETVTVRTDYPIISKNAGTYTAMGSAYNGKVVGIAPISGVTKGEEVSGRGYWRMTEKSCVIFDDPFPISGVELSSGVRYSPPNEIAAKLFDVYARENVLPNGTGIEIEESDPKWKCDVFVRNEDDERGCYGTASINGVGMSSVEYALFPENGNPMVASKIAWTGLGRNFPVTYYRMDGSEKTYCASKHIYRNPYYALDFIAIGGDRDDPAFDAAVLDYMTSAVGYDESIRTSDDECGGRR